MKHFNKSYEFMIRPNNVIWLVFTLFSILTLLTIKIYRLPWFDEVFMADASLNYYKEGKIVEYINNPFELQEELAYGPLYFIINSWVISVFDFGIWQMRIVNLLFGLFVLYLFVKTSQRLNLSTKVVLFGLLLIITDPEFSFSLHSGRMDMVALLFLFLAVYVFFFSTIRRWPKFLLCGILIGLGGLTATRILTLLPLLIFFPLVGRNQKEIKSKFIDLVITFIGFIIIYSFWIYSKFGGIYEYLEYFFTYGSNRPYLGRGSLVNGTLIERFFRSPRNIPIFILFYISIFLYLKYEFRKSSSSIFFIILLCCSFICIIGWGYYFLILPFVYLVVLHSYNRIGNSLNINKDVKFGFKWILIFAFIINILFSSFQVLKVYVTYNDLKYSNTEDKIAQKVKRGSKVFGDYRYYYACKKLNCQFVGMPYNEVSIEEYSPDYIITKELAFSNPKYKYVGDLEYDKWKPTSSIRIIDRTFKWICNRKKYSTNALIFEKRN